MFERIVERNTFRNMGPQHQVSEPPSIRWAARIPRSAESGWLQETPTYPVAIPTVNPIPPALPLPYPLVWCREISEGFPEIDEWGSETDMWYTLEGDKWFDCRWLLPTINQSYPKPYSIGLHSHPLVTLVWTNALTYSIGIESIWIHHQLFGFSANNGYPNSWPKPGPLTINHQYKSRWNHMTQHEYPSGLGSPLNDSPKASRFWALRGHFSPRPWMTQMLRGCAGWW